MSLTAPTIAGETMPEWFYTRWGSRLKWIPPRGVGERITNGKGNLLTDGTWALELRWDTMYESWFRWWVVTILSGDTFVQGDVTIWNPNGVRDETLDTYSDVIIHRPTWGEYTDREYKDVVVRMDGITIDSLPNTVYDVPNTTPGANSLTAPTINGQTMDVLFYERWGSTLRWIPPRGFTERTARNGNGEPYTAGLWSVEWTWDKMEQDWFRWWTVTVLGGQFEATGDVTIWNPNGVKNDTLTTYNDVRIRYPLWEEYTSGMFQGVNVRIDGIPLTFLPTTQYWTVNLTEVGGADVISS